MKIGKQLLAVGIGGTLGATGRYSVSLFFTEWSHFPYATLFVNLVGCFILSWLLHHKQLKQRVSSTLLTALSTGVIGSFTTFSTFAIETVNLLQINILFAIVYIFISVFGGLLSCYIGFKVTTKQQVMRL